jgi:hypothetical protein
MTPARAAWPPPPENEAPAELDTRAGADFTYSEQPDSSAGARHAQRRALPGRIKKPLPPFGRVIKAMATAGLRPTFPSGTVIAALAWDIAPRWPRIVIADEPSQYRLEFARGLDWLVLAAVGHSQEHVAAVVEALREAGAHIVVPVVLPDREPDGAAVDDAIVEPAI